MVYKTPLSPDYKINPKIPNPPTFTGNLQFKSEQH